QDVSSSRDDILQGIQLSKSRSKTGRLKSKKRPTGPVLDVHKQSECPHRPPLNFKVVDSYGEWASLWESQFTALSIPHLRSHMLVHTDPLNKGYASPDHHWSTTKPVILNDVAGGITFSTATPEPVTSVVCAQVKPALICEKHKAPVVDLSILVFCGKCQSSSTVLASEHRAHNRTSGPQAALMSPGDAHVCVQSQKALQEFVVAEDRVAELHCLPDRIYIQDKNAFFNDNRLGKRDRKLLSAAAGLQKSLYFSLPGTQLSVDFFKEQVRKYKLDDVLIKGTVERITPFLSEKQKKVEFFRVTLDTGDTVDAKRVIMASGPTRAQMANIPSWVSAITESYPEERLQHTVELMHLFSRHRVAGSDFTGPPPVCSRDQRVMVIGGGLTSAHIISMALQQGASHVTWVLRKHLQLKQFDVGDVESLIGRYSHVEHGIKLDGLAYLRQFYSERSLHRRLAMIKQARKGGAVTPEAYANLQPFIESGQLLVRAYCQVSEAKWCYGTQSWKVSLSDGEQWGGDRIWLATGCKLDVNHDPLLSDVMREFPIQVLEGWPCISESLQWAPGCPFYLMGQYTALQVGPHAVNLAGGQAAGLRIAKDIIGQHCNKQEHTDAAKIGTTEEYLSHMHGLMWL
ncbi:hypothetical protein NFI96_014253, partial [Prochilodus magdalenae]